MSISDMIPFRKKKNHPLVTESEDHPIVSLHRDLNHIFEQFYRDFEMAPFSGFESSLAEVTPHVDMTDTGKAIKITMELPGMEEKDVEITLSRDMITIHGEKKEEKEDDLKGHYRMERRYGMFNRCFPLPCEIDSEKASAAFKSGVLTLMLPKSPEAEKNVKTIPIKKA